MTISSELVRVARLRARFDRKAPFLPVGIGDDAAVLALLGTEAGKSRLVWTVDAQVEHTHFRTDWVSWEDVGWRSYMAAASDLAAMGAEPVAALSSLVLTSAVDDEALDALTRGQAAAADVVGGPIVGGNFARGTETSITTTLLGRTERPVLRSGARPGDALWLAGPIGLAAAGLALVEKNMHDACTKDDAGEARLGACLEAWRRPRARILEGLTLPRLAHAAIDISDGLARDAWHLAEASGVRVVLDTTSLLAAGGDALVAGCAVRGCDPIELVLRGGEDYALLAASPSALPGFLKVGWVEAHAEGPRVLRTTARGTIPVEPHGFDHFSP